MMSTLEGDKSELEGQYVRTTLIDKSTMIIN